MTQISSIFLSQSFAYKFFSVLIPLTGSMISKGLLAVMCCVFVASLNDQASLAAFGIWDTFTSTICRPFSETACEIGGVHFAKQFGAKEYKKYAGTLGQLFITLTVILSVFAFLSYFSFEILCNFGTEVSLAQTASQLIKWSQCFFWLEAYNNMLQTFIVSQGVITPFFFYNIFLCFVMFFTAQFFIVDCQYKELGMVYTRIFIEILNFIFYSSIILFYCEKETRVFPGLNIILCDLRVFVKRSLYSTTVVFGDYLSYNFNMFLMIWSKNQEDIAVWSAMSNFTIFFYFLSLGFANTFRTIIGNLLGEKKIKQAREELTVTFLYSGIMVAMLGSVLFGFAEEFAGIYLDGKSGFDKMFFGIRFYSCCIFGYLGLYPFFTVFRLLDMDNFIMLVSGLINPLFIISSTSLLVFYYELGIRGLFGGYGLCSISIVLFFIWKTFWDHDWKIDRENHEIDFTNVSDFQI